MSEDYRATHILHECEGKSFKIANIIDSSIVLVDENGDEIKLKISIPKKIVKETPTQLWIITKDRFIIKNKKAKQLEMFEKPSAPQRPPDREGDVSGETQQ